MSCVRRVWMKSESCCVSGIWEREREKGEREKDRSLGLLLRALAGYRKEEARLESLRQNMCWYVILKVHQRNVWHLHIPQLTEGSEVLHEDQNVHRGWEPWLKAGVPWASTGSPEERGELADPPVTPSDFPHPDHWHSRIHLSLPASLTGSPRAELNAVDPVTRSGPKFSGTVTRSLLAVKWHASENVTLLSLSTGCSLSLSLLSACHTAPAACSFAPAWSPSPEFPPYPQIQAELNSLHKLKVPKAPGSAAGNPLPRTWELLEDQE